MTYEQAKNYIFYAVKEGFLDEGSATHLENLPEEEMIKEVEKMADQGDAYADTLNEL